MSDSRRLPLVMIDTPVNVNVIISSYDWILIELPCVSIATPVR
jgi:hypothetical protein